MDDEDFDETGPESDFVASRQCMVFCVDASEESFLEGSVPGKCHLQSFLSSIKKRILHNIFVSDKEYIAIVLMGASAKVGGSNDNTPAKHVVLCELMRPDAKICCTLDTLEKKSIKQFKEDFYEEYEVLPQGSLSDALWTCSSMISLSNTRFNVKDVVIMTNHDLNGIDASTKRQTLKRAEALSQVKICLRLMYTDGNFKLDPFFKDFLMVAHPDTQVIKNSHWAATDIIKDENSILSKAYSNRQSASTFFYIGKETKIAVKAFSLFRRADHVKLRQDVTLHGRTNEQVTRTQTRFDKESGELVHRDSLVYGIKVGDQAAYFTKEERMAMKEIYPVQMTLLGFKSISQVFWDDHIRPGVLILPDDNKKSGSSSLFYALHKVCLVDRKTPLVRVCMRSGSGARLAHLLPQVQCPSATFSTPADCFVMIYQPFQGECRDVPITEGVVGPIPEVVEEAAKIIKKTTLRDMPSIANPKLWMHFRAIEALALEKDEPEPVTDDLQPDTEAIDELIGPPARKMMRLSEDAAVDMQ